MKEIKHLSVHQWLRSAIPDSQQPSSPIGFLFLKLPPPPCAVLLVCVLDIFVYLIYRRSYRVCIYIYIYQYNYMIIYQDISDKCVCIYIYINIIYMIYSTLSVSQCFTRFNNSSSRGISKRSPIFPSDARWSLPGSRLVQDGSWVKSLIFSW